jgi:hypothetical protein
MKRKKNKQINKNTASRHLLHQQAAHVLFAEGEKPTT